MSSTTIPSAIEAVALIFKLNNEMVVRSLDGLSDEECWQRPGGGNPMAWMLGHATVSRAHLLEKLGHYHVGQMGYVRKLLGQSGVAD
jgi:hypothetical protein